MHGIRIYVYSILISFLILFVFSMHIAYSTETDIVVAPQIEEKAKELVEKTENERLFRIGKMAWCVVGAGFFGSAFSAVVNYKKKEYRRYYKKPTGYPQRSKSLVVTFSSSRTVVRRADMGK